MNKFDLVRAISAETGVNYKSTEAFLKTFTSTITKAVAKGDKVSLIGFGSFHSAKRKARVGRNPATGAKINITAKTVPTFVPGKAFKDKVAK